MAQTNVIVKLSLKDAEAVRRGLEQLGEAGERALKRLDTAARAPSAGFKALNEASDELKGRLDGVGQRAGAVGTALRALGPGGLLAAAGIGALVIGFSRLLVETRRVVDELDDLGDAAAKVGVSAETLQELRYAFEQLGVPVERIDANLESFADKIGKVSVQGTHAVKDIRAAFEALHIPLEDVRKADPTELLQRVATEISKLGNTARQAAIAKALGIEDLLPALREGGDALDDLRRKARQLGIVLDEDLVKNAGAVKNELATMQRIIDVQLTQALVNAEPLLLLFARGLAAVAEKAGLVVDRLNEIEQRATHTLKVEIEDLNRQIALQEQNIEKSKAPRNALERGLADIGLNRPQDLEVQQAIAARDRLIAERDRRVAELKRREDARTVTPLRPGATVNVDDPEGTKAQAQLEKELDLVDKWKEAYLKADGDVLEAIEQRRRHELRNAEETIKDSERLAEAKAFINATFDEEIIKADAAKNKKLNEAAAELADQLEKIDQTITDQQIAGLRARGNSREAALAELKQAYEKIETGGGLIEQQEALKEQARRRIGGLDAAEGERKARERTLTLDRLELSLMGESATKRAELVASARAELELREQFPLATDAEIAKLKELAVADARVLTQIEEREEAERQWGEVAKQGIADIVTGFEDAILKAKTFEEALTAVGESLQKIALEAFINKPLERGLDALISGKGESTWLGQLFGSLLGPSGGGGYGNTGAGVNSVSGGTNPGFLLGGVAQGAAFEGGRVIPFARGGIVRRPTLFPMAQGMGLMGEAGPEAVMPLRRTRGGDLGVAGGAVTVNVFNNAGASVNTEESRDDQGNLTIDVMVDAIEAKMAERAQRTGTPLNRALAQASNPLRAR